MVDTSDGFHIIDTWKQLGLHRQIESAVKRQDIGVVTLSSEVIDIIEQNPADLDLLYTLGAELHYSLSTAPHLHDGFLESFNDKSKGKPRTYAMDAFLGGYEGKTFEASTPAFA